MREQVMVELSKELREIMNKFSTMLVALLAANNTKEHNKVMVFLVLIVVVYHLMLVFRTVLVQLSPQSTRLLSIITFLIIALFGGSASVLAVVII
ncbi:hypothetical protein K1719_040299 [Acacia pycnantha]|nr:hypothetical protein K1719_040299 [Acacia pycnantha]